MSHQVVPVYNDALATMHRHFLLVSQSQTYTSFNFTKSTVSTLVSFDAIKLEPLKRLSLSHPYMGHDANATLQLKRCEKRKNSSFSLKILKFRRMCENDLFLVVNT